MVLTVQAHADEQSGLRVRRIHQTGVPIVSQIRPDDQLVLIVRDDETVQVEGAATPDNVINDRLRRADLVGVMAVKDVETLWTEDQTWLITRMFLDITQLLLSRKEALSTGERLEIQSDGGETKVGDVLVRAGSPHPVVRNRQYLMCLQWRSDMGQFELIGPPLLVRNGKLSVEGNAASDKRPRDPFERLSIEDVKRRISQL